MPKKLINLYSPPKSNVQFSEGQKSKGILDDFAQRKVVYMPHTEGSVLFTGAKGEITEDNSNFFWDNTNKRLGLGTTTPSHFLAIGDQSYTAAVGQANPVPRIIMDNTYETGNASVNKFAFYNVPGSWVAGIGMSAYDFDLFSGASGNFRFHTGTTNLNGTGAAEIFTILSTGKVGLGDTNPTYNLNIYTPSSAYSYAQFTNVTTGKGASLGVLVGLSPEERGVFWNYGNTDILIGTNNDEKIRITAGGNVGIGVSDPHSKLEVAGAISSATATLTDNSDNYNVAGINVLFVNITANKILGGLQGGVDGQVLHVVYKGNYTATLTVEDTEGVGTQDIYTHTRLDETIDGGGYTLICDGSNWYDNSHARHV